MSFRDFSIRLHMPNYRWLTHPIGMDWNIGETLCFDLLMREIHLLWNLICIRLLIEAKLKSNWNIFIKWGASYLCGETIVIRHSGIVWMELLSATGRKSALSIRRLLLISCLFMKNHDTMKLINSCTSKLIINFVTILPDVSAAGFPENDNE